MFLGSRGRAERQDCGVGLAPMGKCVRDMRLADKEAGSLGEQTFRPE